MSECQVCPDGYISEEEGATSCVTCEQGTEPNNQHSLCGRIHPLYSV